MNARFCPEIVYACSLETCRPWHGEPGGTLLLRTSPLPRGSALVRLSVRTVLCGDPRARRRMTLCPTHTDEEGLLTVRLPKVLPRALLSVRLCVGNLAGPARLVLV